jgi:MFS family permease
MLPPHIVSTSLTTNPAGRGPAAFRLWFVSSARQGRTPDEEPLFRIAARRTVRRWREDAATPEFGRFLAYQATGAAGDALIALGLAGSLFFSVPQADARDRVALYLLLTMAPFAIAAPFLAAFLDRHRGGMKMLMVAASIGRGVLAWLLSTRLDSLYLFPLAFGILILSRSALVVRGAMLPQLIPEGRSLVNANALLSKVSAIAGMLVGLPGVLLLKWPGEATELLFAAAVYFVGLVPALGLPRVRGRRPLADRMGARDAVRSAAIRQAVLATTGIRFLVGFLVIHLAFAIKREEFGGSIGLGLLIGAAATGGLVGALLAPRLRRRLKEEGILVAALVIAGIAGLLVGRYFSAVSAGILVFAFGVTSGAAKVAFDSIVQRETPEGARGWAFARFEAGFQFAWVLGALIPLAPSIPAGAGVFAAGVVANLVALLYVVGRHRVRSHTRAAGREG